MVVSLLLRYQQTTTSEKDTKSNCEDLHFIAIRGFITSCKKWNNACIVVTNCLRAHSSFILLFISRVASQLSQYTPK